jgi:glycosyltransferase involved in cell wall biosynthesis
MERNNIGKPSLLYVSPVLPSAAGNGLAMRSGMVLEALCEHYRVSALVASLYPTGGGEHCSQNCCDRFTILPPYSNAQDAIRLAAEAYSAESFDAIHVFRLAGVPFAKPYFTGGNARPALHLDLDDIESKANRRLAEVYRMAGDQPMAAYAEWQAQRSWLMECAAFQMFDRIYVCSEADRQQLVERSKTEIRVLRNAVRLPDTVRPPISGATFGFLFVGTLKYYPNKDAVRFFCEQVLPLIRQHAPAPFVVRVLGSGDYDDLVDLHAADVRVIGPVAEVRSWYEQSHAVIVPVRTGGGTRIKILEAFSYRRPVVSTAIGAEGIEAEPDRHILIADTSEAFASACLRLMGDADLARNLVENAASLVSRSHTVDALRTILSSTSTPSFGPCSPDGPSI